MALPPRPGLFCEAAVPPPYPPSTPGVHHSVGAVDRGRSCRKAPRMRAPGLTLYKIEAALNSKRGAQTDAWRIITERLSPRPAKLGGDSRRATKSIAPTSALDRGPPPPHANQRRALAALRPRSGAEGTPPHLTHHSRYAPSPKTPTAPVAPSAPSGSGDVAPRRSSQPAAVPR